NKYHFEIGYVLCDFYGEYEDSTGTPYYHSVNIQSFFCSHGWIEIQDEKNNPKIQTRCGLDKVWITLQQPESVKIFSADGKFVYGMKLSAGESVFEFDFLERGAYIIRIGSTYSEKFIKQ